MFQWATDQFDKLTEVMAPPPTDAAGRFSYAVTKGDENTAMGCIAEIDPVRTVVQQSKGWFPIHMACQYSMLRLIRLLMNQPGVSIQQPDYAGMTPLHHACMTTQKAMGLEVVKILLQEYSADPCVKNSQGQTPYDVATLDSIRQYLLPIQLQRETQYALDNGGVGLAPGIDLGGLKINRSNMAPPPQFGGAGVAAPPPAGGASNMASTPGQSRYPQTPGMAPAPAPAFGSPMATASSTPMSQPIPAAQPIARAPASMPGRKVVTNSARTKSAGASENSRHARNGGSSLAVYSKYKADGFHSSSSDVGLQKKYGHHGANTSVTTPPPSSGNAPGSGNLASSGPNPFSGAGNLGGVSRYASYGPTTTPAPSSVPIYGGMGFSQPAATQPNYFTPGATKAADAPSAGPTSPFMPPPPYSGTTAAEPVTPAAAVATTPAPAVASPFAAPAPAAASNLFDSPPKVAETPAISEEPVQEESKNDETGDWVETTDPTSGQTYYFNTKTNETSWEKPNDSAPATEATTTEQSSVWVETTDPSTGNVYYYNSATGETSWEKPSSMTSADATATTDSEPTAEWVETTDPSSGNVYYYNTVTGETSWDRPVALDSEEKSSPLETSEPEPTADSVPDTASSDEVADSAPVVSEEEEKPVEETPPEETAAEPEPIQEEMESSEIAQEIVVEETSPEETATEPEPIQEEMESSEIAQEIVVEESNEDEAPQEVVPPEESTATETETEIQAEEIKPEVLPDGWTETTDPSSGKVYYYNTKTQETSWERPVAAVSESAEDEAAAAENEEPNSTETTAEDLVEGWEEVQDPSSGKMYYFNKETQETSWEKPTSANAPAVSPSQEESDWVETTDPSTGKNYFYNSKTGETSWEKPASLNAPEDTTASETQQSMGTATAVKETAQSSPVALSHQRTMSADDLFASPPSGQAASFGSQLEEITDSEPQSSPIATEKQPTLSAQDMFASPPSGQAANFGRPDFISPAAATQGSVATPGQLSTPGGDTAEDLFGSPPAKVPETQSAEDLFGAPAEEATENVNEPVVEDYDGMTDIPLSPDPKYFSQPASSSAQPASAPAPAAQEDLFAAIGMPPPPFQRRR